MREYAGTRGQATQVDSVTVRVLVAEDDQGLGEVIGRGLREKGYVVDVVPDGETALRYMRTYEYAVAVLDWRMPGTSGLEVVQRMRRGRSPTPVLMLTARDTPADRVTGLDAGADDYLVKPFDFSELVARIRALQRRPPQLLPPMLVVGDLEFDPASRAARIGQESPSLTAIELGILELLIPPPPALAAPRSLPHPRSATPPA